MPVKFPTIPAALKLLYYVTSNAASWSVPVVLNLDQNFQASGESWLYLQPTF